MPYLTAGCLSAELGLLLPQVYVVPEEEYQPPADNITQPDSRRSRRKDFFSTNGNATGKRTSYDKSALKQALAK